MPFWGQLSLQDAASPVIIQLIHFHDHALLVLTLVVTVIGYALTIIVTNKHTNRQILEAQEIETIWTILPALVLIFLAIPSLRLLYIMDEISSPSVTLKAIGHQWYWRYEYSDFTSVSINSYITATSDLNVGEYRLLETDNHVVLPIQLEVRVLITAADVIHSWAIPSLGVKVDAIPGRLNQIGFTILTPGLYYGQCSEICGANHSFIPIAIEAISPKAFASWLVNYNK
jgi:cytochrome c oxidase subunit 2